MAVRLVSAEDRIAQFEDGRTVEIDVVVPSARKTFVECTKAALIYKATDNLRAIQILLEHTKIENTVRDLGVDIYDELTLAEMTEI